MTDTLVPGVIDALATVFRAALLPHGVPGSAVSDGPFTGSDIPADYCTVGWSTSGPPDVVGTASGEGNDDRSELFEVYCELSLSTGDATLTALTARAGVLLSAIGDALRADHTLGGYLTNQDSADRTGNFTWERDVGTTGATVAVSFVVHVSVGWLP